MPKQWEKTDGKKIADIIAMVNQIHDRLMQIDRKMTEHELDWIFTTWTKSHDMWFGRVNDAIADTFGEIENRIYSKKYGVPTRIEADKARNGRPTKKVPAKKSSKK